MFGRILICLVALSIVACASTGTEPAATSSTAGNVASENAATLAEANVEAPEEANLEEATASADYDPDEKICRRERQTGSNFSVRICQTRAEMEARAKADQEIMEQYQRKRACGSAECL